MPDCKSADKNRKNPQTEKTDTVSHYSYHKNKFRCLYENSPFGIIICELITDPQGQPIDFIHIEVNPATAAQTGFSVDQILGKRASEILTPAETADLACRYGKVVATGEPLSYTQYFPVYDRCLEVRAFRLAGKQFFLNFSDITDRKRAEEALQEREQLLSQVEDIAKIGGWEMDLEEGGRATWTKGTYDIGDIEPGMPIPGADEHLDWYLPEYRDMIRQKMQDLIETRQPLLFEAMVQTYKGNLKWCQAIGEVVEKNGKVVKLRGTFQDITLRKQMEEALQDSEGRFRSVFESKMIGILFWNAEGDITDANDAFLAMVGYRRDDVLSGKVRWRDMTPPEYAEQDKKALEEIAATGAMTPVEKEYICRDGRRIPIFLGAASLPGPPLTGVAFVLDISERKRAEQASRQAQEALLDHQRHETECVEAELTRVKEELVRKARLAAIGQVSAMAHDLRNPLGAARNACYLLRRRLGQDESRLIEPIEIIDQEIVHADRIITNLLSIARSRSPQKENVDLGSLFRDVCRRQENSRLVECRVDLNPDPFVMHIDREQFAQVISNLLANAVQAMDGPGILTMRAQREDGADTIEFDDTGPGLDPKVRNSLFDPLITTKARGTGLGLTICKQIVEAHGGTIEAGDGAGGGAVIRICLGKERD
ncbi:PAS domain S-box protein [Planctomycetota bacterium]